ncbi:MAG: hypothetical protein GEU77_06565 [Deltaproteobacteria bacterium]|nr:hypothetical protein [Deltaproteobacteria bacterium]
MTVSNTFSEPIDVPYDFRRFAGEKQPLRQDSRELSHLRIICSAVIVDVEHVKKEQAGLASVKFIDVHVFTSNQSASIDAERVFISSSPLQALTVLSRFQYATDQQFGPNRSQERTAGRKRFQRIISRVANF